MVPWCEPGAAQAALYGPAAPLWRRLSIATALSIALHTAVVYGVRPTREAAQAPGPMLTVRFAPAPAPPDERRGDQTAPLHEHSVSLPADAAARSAEQTRFAGLPQSHTVPLPAPRYYLASELDRQPVPLLAVEPKYPAEAGSREGFVVLRLLINELGSVDDLAVFRAEPSGVFEKSALATFAAARFSPGILSGAAVKSQLLVEVQYHLENHAVSGRGY